MDVAKQLYAAGKKQDCYERLVELLRRDPKLWLGNHYFVNAAFDDVGRLDELNGILDAALAAYPGFNFSHDEHAPELVAAMQKQRRAAQERGVPPILIICQHKSGSEAIHTRLADAFALPTVRISMQTMPVDHVIESWARDFAAGGCLGGPHLNATPENLDKLVRAGIRRLVVHVRDPRQALLSQTHYVRTVRDSADEEQLIYREFSDQSKPLTARIDECLDRYLDATVQWITDWLAAADQFEILFTTYEQFRFDAARFYEDITAFFGLPALPAEGPSFVGSHFRSGRSNEWMIVFSSEQRRRCAERIPVALLRRFHWPREAQTGVAERSHAA